MTIFALSFSTRTIRGGCNLEFQVQKQVILFKLITNKDLPSPRKAKLLKINNINNSQYLIDEGIILWFPDFPK